MDFYEIKLTNKSGTIHTPCNTTLDISEEEKAETACQLIAEFACDIATSGEYDEFLEDVKEVFRFIRLHKEGVLDLDSCIVTIHKKHND